MPSHEVLQQKSDRMPQLELLDVDPPARDRLQLSDTGASHRLRRSHSVTAEIDVPSSGAEGVIVAQGGRMGAWSLYAEEGRLKYHYSYVGMLHSEVSATSVLPAGRHQTRMEFTFEGAGMNKGGRVSLYVDGRKVGEGRILRTHDLFFSQRERVEVGCDVAGSGAGDLSPRSDAFNGKIHWVQIGIDEAAGGRRAAAAERGQAPLRQ